MASRHRSRELAVQLSYQIEFAPNEVLSKKVLQLFWEEQAKTDDTNRPFFEFIVQGVAEHLPAIDRKINTFLKNWKMDRVEKVDLAILRVAIFELFFSEDPEKPDAPVVINEAVEIAKKFGSQGSPGFVNGLLDAMMKP